MVQRPWWWCSVHGDGAWCILHSAWCMVHCAWCMMHGCEMHGAWCMMHGAWCMIHPTRKTFWKKSNAPLQEFRIAFKMILRERIEPSSSRNIFYRFRMVGALQGAKCIVYANEVFVKKELSSLHNHLSLTSQWYFKEVQQNWPIQF